MGKCNDAGKPTSRFSRSRLQGCYPRSLLFACDYVKVHFGLQQIAMSFAFSFRHVCLPHQQILHLHVDNLSYVVFMSFISRQCYALSENVKEAS
jgi:hypothetical protein